MAPAHEQTKAATFDANAWAGQMSYPAASIAQNAAVNESPAPTVSDTFPAGNHIGRNPVPGEHAAALGALGEDDHFEILPAVEQLPAQPARIGGGTSGQASGHARSLLVADLQNIAASHRLLQHLPREEILPQVDVEHAQRRPLPANHPVEKPDDGSVRRRAALRQRTEADHIGPGGQPGQRIRPRHCIPCAGQNLVGVDPGGIPAFVDDAGRQLPDAAKPVAKPAGLQFGRHRAAALIVPDRADHMHLRRIRAGNQPGALEEMIGEIGRRAAEGIFVRHDIVVVKHLAQSDSYDLVRIPHTSRRFIPVPSPCRPCGP